MSSTSAPRGWFRFSLRTLLVGVVVFALLLAIPASLIYEGRRHQRIARDFEALDIEAEIWGPISHYHLMGEGGGGPPRRHYSRSAIPPWVDQLGLRPALEGIDRIEFFKPRDLPKALNLLKELGTVDTLWIDDPRMTYEQLSDALSHMRVRRLCINELPLPRDRIPWLNQRGLTWLRISRTDFSNPAIDDLPKSLEYCDASRTHIDDNGLPKFVRLKNLKTLNLSRTPTTPAAIQRLRGQMPWCEISWEELKRPSQ